MKTVTRNLVYVTRNPCAELRERFEESGWHVTIAGLVREVRHAVQAGPVVGGLLDLAGDFQHREIAALESCLAVPNVRWVAIARAGQLEDGLNRRLVRDYCFDYLTLPAARERIVDAVGHACGMVSLGEPESGEAPLASAEGEMVGSSDVMLALFRTIRKVATTDAPVFISGESGTGKELTAIAIHERSRRRNAPFVAINCGAIPPHLLQSELFGHERGAFTGANQRRIGRIEAASGGTLFLDEIGDLPLESQASLLRFLQEGTVDRLGGHGSTNVDVRVICAMHVDMNAAMAEGRFRPDLYHRLCVLQIDEPPLRTRGKDIELLALSMLERFRNDASRRLQGFTPDAITALHHYPWPGNVRELINRVRRAIVMAEGRRVTARDLELSESVEIVRVTLSEAREAAERQAIELALLRHRGRLGDAARELGISRVTLYRLLTAHGMRQGESDASADA
ncbi:sigma-54 dependent transcriptional regulator [Paraburkholderia domus]|uniref:sigma-54 dependent transcriptional regulator n=1 Tax=Paraburkholderia domus TaxID=2793075 RepID=UPI0019126C4F|nr:sigma-54 dependent transcriptional regulator [Paraburkholderia domus]MBK5065687.1 sigma-54-dependent Fis family transcriptional regulator [Burkholderia sp. R-70199]CAE6961642.1 Anaerobic nitric oxide reductase transcription regulator NorR [Paraburkholderia domus]